MWAESLRLYEDRNRLVDTAFLGERYLASCRNVFGRFLHESERSRRNFAGNGSWDYLKEKCVSALGEELSTGKHSRRGFLLLRMQCAHIEPGITALAAKGHYSKQGQKWPLKGAPVRTNDQIASTTRTSLLFTLHSVTLKAILEPR